MFVASCDLAAHGLAPSRFVDPLIAFILVLFAFVALVFRTNRGTQSRRLRRARTLGLGLGAGLWLMSTPFFSWFVVRAVQPEYRDPIPLLGAADATRSAMVVLSGGMQTDELTEPLVERFSAATKGRLMGAARFYQRFPFGTVVVTDSTRIGAQGMAEFLVMLGVPRERIVIDGQANDTKANADNSVRILKERDVEHTLLVTSALHIRRAVWEFKRHGLDVIAGPVDYINARSPRWDASYFIPSSGALAELQLAVKEIFGHLKP